MRRARTGPRTVALVGWTVLAVAVPGWLALVEVFWLPLRLGPVLVPVSVVAAVVGNLLLVDSAHRLSRSRLVGVLPAVVWATVALAASTRRPEGDLVLTGGRSGSGFDPTAAVNLGFLLLGVGAAAFAVGRVLSRRPDAPRRAGARPPAAGSGSGGAR